MHTVSFPGSRAITLQDAVILCFGAPQAPVNLKEAYRYYVKISNDFRNNLAYSMLSFQRFEEYVNKLTRKGFLLNGTIVNETGQVIHAYSLTQEGNQLYQMIAEHLSQYTGIVRALKFIRSDFEKKSHDS